MKDGRDRWTEGQRRARKGKEHLTAGERRRLAQLLICLLLFAMVFIGRGAPEGRLRALGDHLSVWVQQDTDFRQMFSKIGKSVSEGEPFVQTFGLLWSEVFGGEVTQESPKEDIPPVESPLIGEGESVPPQEPISDGEVATTGGEAQVAEPVVEPVTEPVGEVEPSLLPGEMATPVMGILTSSFGYRTHPIDGEWKQHDGIDIMADEGTAIGAFGAGVVEYIGESPAYGLYLRIRHDEGVSSFYAHCSQLFVKPEQVVAAGETVALVGSTGNVTGAHLHFELKKDGQHIDPTLYVQTQSP